MDTNRWSNLPVDILSKIAKRLKSDDMDIRRLRAVCSSWRSSVPSPKIFPPIEVPFHIKSSSEPDTPFVLSRRTLLLISPLKGGNHNTDHDDYPTPTWVIQVTETAPNKWLLLDPLIAQFQQPFSNCSDQLPNGINLLDFKVIEICRSFDLCSVDLQLPVFLLSLNLSSTARKTILQADNKEMDDGNFTLCALFGNGNVAFWRSGAGSWTHLEYKGYGKIVEMVEHKGEIYAVINGGRLMKIHIETCRMTEVVTEPLDISTNYGTYYLVEYNEYLYLLTFYVVQVGVTIINHKVYVLNEENANWEIANDLGGAAFFVGYDTVFPVSAKDIGLPEGANVLYFEGYSCYNPEKGRDEVCSLKCYLNSDSTLINNWWPNRAPFWPPPEWIKQI